MTRKEAISFIHNFIKTAEPQQLRNVICGIYSPKCSNECPLRKIGSYECEPIIDIGELNDKLIKD